MRKLILVWCCLALALGMLAGCNQADDQGGGEAAEGVPIAPADTPTAGDQGDMSKGATATAAAGGAVEMPAGWPASLPQYPDSQIVAAYSSGEGGDRAFAVNLSTSGTPEQVMAFYEEKALAAGYAKVNAISGEERSFAHYTSGAWNFNVTCTVANGSTGVMLGLGTSSTGGDVHIDDGGEPAGTDSGGQSGTTVADVLKEYPQGQVEHSVSRGSEHLMTQTTVDPAGAVVKFYTDYFSSSGWELEAAIDSETGMMRTFKGASGQVVLNANPRDGGTFITLTYKQQ